jgi:general secretion pathway protein G
MRHGKTPHGFTMIELLTVIAIIAILAALVLNTAGYIQKKAARSRAEAEIAALSAALESYKAEYGTYPEAPNNHGVSVTEGANVLYQALVLSNSLNPLGKVFFEPGKGNVRPDTSNFANTANYFVDPFGQPYQYQYPGDANKSGSNFFDLWSYGGVTGTKATDTATNWEFWVKNW